MTDRTLFSSPLLTVAEFRCPPTDNAWHTENTIGDWPLISFPRVPVGITFPSGRRLLATPNLAMLYNAGQPYERHLRDRRGDECLYIQLHGSALESLEPESEAIRDGRLVVNHAPANRLAYFHQHLLARYLEGSAPDALLAEETAIRLVRGVLPRARSAPPLGRSATAASHRNLAEDAKELLAAAVEEKLSLQQIALRLSTSPFHLARVFRRETGFSLHDYRKQLRLRLALEQLPASNGGLTSLALRLGFSSHSHFTDTFRREFGVAPSVVRDAVHVRMLLEAA
jgi:AraC family transcriptional regulator